MWFDPRQIKIHMPGRVSFPQEVGRIISFGLESLLTSEEVTDSAFDSESELITSFVPHKPLVEYAFDLIRKGAAPNQDAKGYEDKR